MGSELEKALQAEGTAWAERQIGEGMGCVVFLSGSESVCVCETAGGQMWKRIEG